MLLFFGSTLYHPFHNQKYIVSVLRIIAETYKSLVNDTNIVCVYFKLDVKIDVGFPVFILRYIHNTVKWKCCVICDLHLEPYLKYFKPAHQHIF